MANEKTTSSVTAEELMEQAQTYASTWASVGGPFDDGNTLALAEEEKAKLWRLVERRDTETQADILSECIVEFTSEVMKANSRGQQYSAGMALEVLSRKCLALRQKAEGGEAQ